jgi:hypothetical protein
MKAKMHHIEELMYGGASIKLNNQLFQCENNRRRNGISQWRNANVAAIGGNLAAWRMAVA